MFRTIVVGADKTPSAEVAVLAAVELARLSRATVHIVTSYRPATLSAKVPAEFANSLQSVELADALLSNLASIARTAGVPVETHAGTRSAAELVCDVAAEVAADVIVVGNRGMRGARRVLGSVPNKVAHTAPCSVLIVNTTRPPTRDGDPD